MSSKRFVSVWGILLAGILIVVLSEGCGETEQALGPTEQIQQPALEFSESVIETKLIKEGLISVAIPISQELKEIYDPYIADAILSMLPDAMRIRLSSEGSVLINDVNLSTEIALMAGFGTFDISSGIMLFESWSCIKCIYAEKPYCIACPQCCEKDKGYADFVYY